MKTRYRLNIKWLEEDEEILADCEEFQERLIEQAGVNGSPAQIYEAWSRYCIKVLGKPWAPLPERVSFWFLLMEDRVEVIDDFK